MTSPVQTDADSYTYNSRIFRLILQKDPSVYYPAFIYICSAAKSDSVH